MAEKQTVCVGKEGGYEAIPQKLYSLAMAFVPQQTWQDIYECNVALARGTIFADLDLPFIGEEAVSNERK